MTSARPRVAGPIRPVPRRVPAAAGAPRGTRAATVAARAGTVAACIAIAAAVLAPDATDRVAVPVALAGVLIGIPHGAVDHMVPFWSAGTRPTVRALARGLLVYLAVAIAAAAALLLAPAPVVLGFLVVSAVHFGRGEVAFAAARAGRAAPGPTVDLPETLVHGAVVVLIPLTLWHARSAPVLGALAPSLARPVPGPLLAAVAVAVVVAALLVAGRLLRAHRGREAAELLLVLTLFLAVPPLVAFGVYFGAWHAVRHTGRLLALPGPHGVPLPFGAALRRYLAHAAAPTLVAVTALVVADRVLTVAAVPVALAVLLALTFPHLWTVARLDHDAAGAAPPGLIRPEPRSAAAVVHPATPHRG